MGGQNEPPQKVPLCHVDYFQLKTMGAQQTQEGSSQVALVVKNPPANAGDIRDAVLKPGLERSHGGGNGNPLQYSCLENPKDRGAWRLTVHKVTEARTRLK